MLNPKSASTTTASSFPNYSGGDVSPSAFSSLRAKEPSSLSCTESCRLLFFRWLRVTTPGKYLGSLPTRCKSRMPSAGDQLPLGSLVGTAGVTAVVELVFAEIEGDLGGAAC